MPGFNQNHGRNEQKIQVMNSKAKADGKANPGLNLSPDTSGCPIQCLPDLIRRRAYEFYEARGRVPGHEMEDWLRAELEIKHRLDL
jgi:hypothetical protein